VRESSQSAEVQEIREGGGGGERRVVLVADEDIEGNLSTGQGGAEAVVVVSERLVVLQVRGGRGWVLGKGRGGRRGGRGDDIPTHGTIECRFTFTAVIPGVGAQSEGTGAAGGSGEKKRWGGRAGREEGGGRKKKTLAS